MKNFLLILVFALLIFCVSSNYFIMKSLRGQYILEGDNAVKYSLSQVDSILPFYPFASVASMPLDLIRASAAFTDGNPSKGYDFLQSARKQNPYSFYPELILSRYHFQLGNLDSAYYYSNLSFYGWPKNIEHFQNHLKILAIKGDTIGILNAGKFVDEKVSNQIQYIKILKESLNKAKLTYLVSDYPDASNISLDQIKGKWLRAYNFRGSKSIIDSLKGYSFSDKFTYVLNNNDSIKYKFSLKDDSLSFYFPNKPDPFYKQKVLYSEGYSTLIFYNVKIQDAYQNQYFKKIND